MKDGVYCSNGSCPFEDCKSHLKHLAGRELEGEALGVILDDALDGMLLPGRAVRQDKAAYA